MPKIAKHTGGAAPIRPRIHAGTATSASTSARIGDSDATAERREKATSTMPVKARSLPRHRERGRASVTRSSLRPACGVEAASPRGRRVPSGGDGLAGGPRGREASSAGRIPSPQRTARRLSRWMPGSAPPRTGRMPGSPPGSAAEGCRGQLSCEPSIQERYSSVTVPVMYRPSKQLRSRSSTSGEPSRIAAFRSSISW